jgi:hypothetical protein
MVAEVEMVGHTDQVVFGIGILGAHQTDKLVERFAHSIQTRKKRLHSTYPFVQVVQDLDFNNRLTVEALLVPDNLDGYILACLVIVALGHLTKRTFAQHIQDLVAIHKMIMVDDQVVTTLIVISYQ